VKQHTCYYDGACGRCRRTVRLLRTIDWLGRLAFRDLLTADDLPVEPEVALRGMTMRTAGGRVLVGFSAVRRALLETPLGFLPALITLLPGLSHALSRLYDRSAARRRRDACSLNTADTARILDTR